MFGVISGCYHVLKDSRDQGILIVSIKCHKPTQKLTRNELDVHPLLLDVSATHWMC